MKQLIRTVGDLRDATASLHDSDPVAAFLWLPEACCPDGFDANNEHHQHDIPEVFGDVFVARLGAGVTLEVRP